MTLYELVKKYRGDIRFDVDAVVEESDESKDVVVFMNNEVDAIKEEIVNGEVIKYSAVFGQRDAMPYIKVLAKIAEPSPDPDPDPDHA